jgi:ketosteroid isomerase-like protein
MAAHQQMRICCASELEEVVVVGEVAYTRSRDALSVTPRAGGNRAERDRLPQAARRVRAEARIKAAQLAGHRMTIYRKQRDGRWLLSRDVHTLSAVEK